MDLAATHDTKVDVMQEGIMHNITSDEVLVRRVKAGDVDASEVLYFRYRERIYRYFFKRTSDENESKDLTQETFLQAFKNVHSLKDESKFSRWLWRIAKSQAANYWRFIHRSTRTLEMWKKSLLNKPEQKSHEDVAEEMEFQNCVVKTFDRLTRKQQDVFWWHLVEELTFSEIAEIMGSREDSPRKLFKRALSEVKAQCFSELDDEKSEKLIKQQLHQFANSIQVPPDLDQQFLDRLRSSRGDSFAAVTFRVVKDVLAITTIIAVIVVGWLLIRSASIQTTPINRQTAPLASIEDFEADSKVIWWSPDPDVFEYLSTNEQAHEGNRSFKIRYEKTDTFQFVGAELAPEMRDFSKYSSVEVWVYGQVNLLLKIEDVEGKQVDVSEQVANNPNGWTPLRFDYSHVSEEVDLRNIAQLFFFPSPGDPRAGRTIFLDDIILSGPPIELPFSDETSVDMTSNILSETTQSSAMLEDFENVSQVNWWSLDTNVFEYFTTDEQAHFGDRSFKITYQKTDTFQFVGAELAPEMRDFSDYGVVEVWVYGQVDLLLRFEDVEGKQADIGEQVATNLDGWSRLRFDYSHISEPIDLTQIHQIYLFPSPGDPGASRTIFLDDISLSQ
jgi:RNA polymerase sigma-70 factor (ECF subfamily)